MTKIQKILFPLDFSPESAEAVEYVKQRARQFEASITILRVAIQNISSFTAVT
jgi:nucleotide-binding universal stress UspA family protein